MMCVVINRSVKSSRFWLDLVQQMKVSLWKKLCHSSKKKLLCNFYKITAG